MAFAEKGVACALETHPPQSPEILALNPFGKMPTYRCGEFTLYETSAIMRHLDETMPGPALMPKEPVERAKAEQWISALNCYGYPAMVRNYVLQYVFPRGPDGKPDRATIDAALPEIRKVLGALDRAIDSRDHLVGDSLTLADILHDADDRICQGDARGEGAHRPRFPICAAPPTNWRSGRATWRRTSRLPPDGRGPRPRRPFRGPRRMLEGAGP